LTYNTFRAVGHSEVVQFIGHAEPPGADRNRAAASPGLLLAPVMTTTFPAMLLLIERALLLVMDSRVIHIVYPGFLYSFSELLTISGLYSLRTISLRANIGRLSADAGYARQHMDNI